LAEARSLLFICRNQLHNQADKQVVVTLKRVLSVRTRSGMI